MENEKYWIGQSPEKCDICGAAIGGVFIDGATIMGPWACMCPVCHVSKGVGFGMGQGQRYNKINDPTNMWRHGKWLKVAG